MVSFKGVVLTIGIAVILTLFIHYGLTTFLKRPNYNDFCETESCRAEYDKARESYEQTRFIVLISLGAAAIVAGGLMFTFEGIGTGILGGGIITAVSGTVSYWRHMGDVVRFLMLGFVLAVLIGIGIIVALREKEKKLAKQAE